MQQQLHVMIAGRVQGVGFRYATQRKAGLLGLTGWVRNTREGSVEAVFQGERRALNEMLRWCNEGPVLSRIDEVECNWSDATDSFEAFEIAF